MNNAYRQVLSIAAVFIVSSCAQPVELPYTDSFDDDLQGNWVQVDETNLNSTWTLADGQYQQLADMGFVASHGAFDATYHLGTFSMLEDALHLSDYQVEVDVTLRSDFGDECGLMWRVQNADNYHRLVINYRDGMTLLQSKIQGTWHTLARNTRAVTPGQRTRLTVISEGDLMSISQDQQHQFSATDNRLQAGTIALYSRGACAFDNLSIIPAALTPTIRITNLTAFDVTSETTFTAHGVYRNVAANQDVTVRVSSESQTCNTTRATLGSFSAECRLVAGKHTLTAEVVQGNEPIAESQLRDVQVGGMRIGTVGDSITFGRGDNYQSDGVSRSGRRISFGGYQSNLEDYLAAAQPPLNTIIFSAGIAGDQTPWIAQRMASYVEQHPNLDHVLVMAGTNDAINGRSSGLNCADAACTDTYAEALANLLHPLTALDHTIWLAKPPPIWGPTKLIRDANPAQLPENHRIREYAEVIDDQFSSYRAGPDFYDYFIGERDRSFLFADSYHPNGLGYALFAALWRNTLVGDTALPYIVEQITVRVDGQPVVPSYYQQTFLEAGDTYTVDEAHTLIAVPDSLRHARWILPANQHKHAVDNDYLTVDLGASPVDVYVAFPQGSRPSWLAGWHDVGQALRTTNPDASHLRLYQQTGLLGTVAFGGAEGAPSNYLVAVLPPPTPLP